MLYEPKIGKKFPVTAEEIDAETRYLNERTRSLLVVFFLAAGILALAVSAGVAILGEDDGPLIKTALFLFWPFAWMIRYYFRGKGTNGQEADEGTTGPS